MNCSTRDRLTELVPPPRTATAVDWGAAETALGITFPSGYRWLAETYGPSVFDDFLRLYMPGSTALDMVQGTAVNSGLNRSWLDGSQPPRFSWPLHPEPGGLVLWAQTVDREALFWATAGPPDEWPVVVESFESHATWRHDGPCEDLLLMLLERTVEVPHFVRLNGRVYEALAARLQRRRPCDLYHSALRVEVPEGNFVIEQAPVRDWSGSQRGVVAEGAVGARWAGRFRVFRYEIRRWRDGYIPDVAEAADSPRRLTDDDRRARVLLDQVARVPTPVWGRNELRTGEMWNSTR